MSSKIHNNSSDRDNNFSEEKRANLLFKKYNKIIEEKRSLEKELKLIENEKSFSKHFIILEKLLLLDPFNKNYLEKFIDLLNSHNYEVLAEKFKIILENIDSKISSNSSEDIFDEKNNSYNLYQKVETLLNEKKYLEARNLIIENLFENSNDEFLNYLQAKTYYYMGDLLKAQVILEDLLTTNPDFIIAKNDLSVIYYQNGLVDKAIDILKTTIDSGTYNLDILKNLANIYKEIEKFEEAINIFHIIIQKYPEDTEALLSMSKLSYEAGYIDDAILYASKASDIDKNNHEIKNFLQDLKNQKNITEKKKTINKETSKNVEHSDLVSIIIVTYNNLFFTRETIKSVIKYSDIPYEIIVIDNASTDGSQDYLRNNTNLKVILNDTNIGFAAACNQGISIAKGNYILLLNNDVIVTNFWLSRMLAYMSMDPAIGIVAPVTNYISGPQLDTYFLSLKVTEEDIKNNGDSIIQQYSEYLFNKNRQNGLFYPRVTGFCMLIRSNLIKKIGGFDERFYIGNYEDDDFCLRTRIAGFKIVIASDVFIYHFGSKSFQLMEKEKYIELLQENKKKFIEKYGVPPEDTYKNEDLRNFNKIDYKINIHQFDTSLVIHSSNTISLCMIAKNEERNLQKCIDSVIDFVNEIIIVDTGSEDSTVEIAKKNKAKVINTVWNNDFSESRNLALNNATSKWILVLDADEVLEFDSTLELLNLINKNNFDALTVKIHNILDDESLCKYEILPLTRVFKNDEKYRYEGIVHEQIKFSILRNNGKIKDSNIKILHSGYKTSNDTKIKRNIDLLKKALESAPDNPHYIYQLGITLFSQDNNDESINYLLQAYEFSKNNPDFFGEYSFEKLLLKISQYYLQHNNIEKAEEFNNILISRNNKNYIAIYIKAAILFEKKEYQKSLELLNELKNSLIENNIDELDIHQIYIDLGNNYYILEDYESAFNCFQKALEINNNSYIACYNIANLLYRIGHYEDAQTMFEWSLKLNPSLDKAKEKITKIKELLTKKNE
jgi:GT2 family glycosyltransferase/predicted Zn-dependent protease